MYVYSKNMNTHLYFNTCIMYINTLTCVQKISSLVSQRYDNAIKYSQTYKFMTFPDKFACNLQKTPGTKGKRRE